MSNAAIAGMTKDLRLDIGVRYSLSLLIFFVPYFIFELPSNIVLRQLGAAKWLGTIVTAWGVVMIGMGFTKNWTHLVACRAILGLFEAGKCFRYNALQFPNVLAVGFFPACVYLVSCWYVRFEVQKRYVKRLHLFYPSWF